ncbi:MAG: hypothetical protein KY475_09830 [Planctomycetes bacterium]|nr:hypothetical protein [Planctomycetota bacterium]
MSDSPFRDLPETNPYAPPSRHREAGNPLVIPAVFLLAFAIIFLLIWVISIPGQVVRLSSIDTSTPEGTGEFAGGIMFLFMAIIFDLWWLLLYCWLDLHAPTDWV